MPDQCAQTCSSWVARSVTLQDDLWKTVWCSHRYTSFVRLSSTICCSTRRIDLNGLFGSSRIAVFLNRDGLWNRRLTMPTAGAIFFQLPCPSSSATACRIAPRVARFGVRRRWRQISDQGASCRIPSAAAFLFLVRALGCRVPAAAAQAARLRRVVRGARCEAGPRSYTGCSRVPAEAPDSRRGCPARPVFIKTIFPHRSAPPRRGTHVDSLYTSSPVGCFTLFYFFINI